ncbi:MAG: LamG-like jellyroll fold domain-containing protein [Limisphaerales bacterium]
MKSNFLNIVWARRLAVNALLGMAWSLFAFPSLLSAQTLQHRYSFVSDASDSVGTANGTIVSPNGGSPVTINNGLVLPGGGGPGFSGYVTLPAGILDTTTNLTIECWVTQSSQDSWAELWNFNNGTSQYLGYIPYPANNNNDMSLADKNGNESDAFSQVLFPNGVEEHITATFNAANLEASLYVGPNLVASVSTPDASYIPGTYNTANNYLGQDPFPDPQWQGTIYEFRIYNGALTPFRVAVDDVAGSTNIVTDFTPTSAVFVAGTNVVLTGTEQAAINVTLAATGTNIFNAASVATNWISSNPNVIQVDGGVIKGVGFGTATVSATVHGITATSATITVSPQVLQHRYSFASDASDSVGGANGSIVPPANASGQPATINNGLILPGNTQGGFGYSGYVLLPPGLLTNTTSLTVECWVTQNQGNSWAEIWDFAESSSVNFALIPYPQNNGENPVVAFTPSGGEHDVATSTAFPNGSEQYVALTYNNQTLAGDLYTNGVLDATTTLPNATYCPGTFGGSSGTVSNMLGNDIFGDQQFSGTIYEFRIWNGALTPVYEAVAAAAGPAVIITNTMPQSLALGLSTTSMVGADTQQATATGNFIQVANVNVTSAATNWTSSNPSVLTVSSNGLITAQSGGSATVSATVNGITATSATVTVANTSPTFSQKPTGLTLAVNDTATFSASALGGGLNYQWDFNGNPIPGATSATLSVSNLSLTNAGTYTVVVSNNLGSTNADAVLTVDQAILLHRYSFVSDASDSVGGANGTIVAPKTGAPATVNNGLVLPGNTSGGFGYSGYVSLPNGILTNTTSLTIETWVTQNSQNNWATIWDFADNGGINFELCPFNNNARNNSMMFSAFTPANSEHDLNSDVLFPSGSEQYVAETVNASTLVGNLYTNGVPVGSTTLPDSSFLPHNIGGQYGTIQDMLGNDTFGDYQFSGTIYEFRIWDGAVTPLYLAVASAAGPSVVVTNLVPTSVSVTVTNNTMVQGQIQPTTALGNFLQVSGVPLTGSVTNWTSSNISVLTVNNNGLVMAVGTGSATISATVAGVTGTSATISVPSSPPVITQEPETNDVFFEGGTLTASVNNIGTPPFVYRWFFNGGLTPISTSANPALIIPNLQLSDAGTYSVLVSNVDGSVLSSNLTVSVVTPSPYEQTVMQYGPVAYWPLQETAGTIAYDVIGADNGTYMTTPVAGSSYSLAQPGPSQSFFGASSTGVGFIYAIADIPVGRLDITGPITVTAWVQVFTPAQFASIVGHGDNSWRISITENGDSGGALPGANDGLSGGDANGPVADNINDANWHMLTYTYSGNPSQPNNGLLYLDGVQIASNSITATPPGSNLDVWIGGSPDYGTGRLLTDANVAHVAVFDQAFTAAQVEGIYNATYVLGPQTLAITQSGTNVMLNWQTGTLLEATNVQGPWTTNSLATPPYTVPATNKASFFRLLVSP